MFIKIGDPEFDSCLCRYIADRVAMDKEIKKGFEKVKKTASKEEKSLVKKDIKRDKKCEKAEKMKRKR